MTPEPKVGQVRVTFSNAISDRTRPHVFTFDTIDEAREFAAGYWPFNNTRVNAFRVLDGDWVERIDLQPQAEPDATGKAPR